MGIIIQFKGNGMGTLIITLVGFSGSNGYWKFTTWDTEIGLTYSELVIFYN